VFNIRWRSFRFAFNGIRDLIRTQVNARMHLLVSAIVVFAGFFFQISLLEWCVVLLAMGLVLAAEAFNTALEYLTNLVSPDYHPLAGKVKDVAAGAVLIVTIISVVIGVLIFLPRIIAWLHTFG
jgi:diacylglycerol kinase